MPKIHFICLLKYRAGASGGALAAAVTAGGGFGFLAAGERYSRSNREERLIGITEVMRTVKNSRMNSPLLEQLYGCTRKRRFRLVSDTLAGS